MAKQILFDEAARAKLLAGFEKLSKAVAVTMGPRGRNVILQKSFGGPQVTKDGVLLAREIEFDDDYENIGAQWVSEVVSKVSDSVGDGTSTATVLAQVIFRDALKLVAAGSNPMAIRRGIAKATEAVVQHIQNEAHLVTSQDAVGQIATIAAGNDDLVGHLLANTIAKVGRDGAIVVEKGDRRDTAVLFEQGYQFDRGYLSPYFITDQSRFVCELRDCYVAISDQRISSIKQLIGILERASKENMPLLIIAEDIEGEAVTLLSVNKLRGTLQVCAVKAPGFGDRRKAMLEDIAVVTGGVPVTSDAMIESAERERRIAVKLTISESVPKKTLDAFTEALAERVTAAGGEVSPIRRESQIGIPVFMALGRCRRAIIDSDTTVLIGGAGTAEAIRDRCEQIRHQIATVDSEYDREKLEDRLARLSGGVACIRVGGETEIEILERTSRIEDALHATRAALTEGIVPGGGVALLRAQNAIKKLDLRGDEELGAKLLGNALESPMRMIAENAGVDADSVIEHVRSLPEGHGFDAMRNEYVDMIKAGIVDPVAVTRTALTTAVSIASLLVSTEVMVRDTDAVLKDEELGSSEVH